MKSKLTKEQRQIAEAERVSFRMEEANQIRYEGLKTALLKKHEIEIRRFERITTRMPQYLISKRGVAVGFCDIIYGKWEPWQKLEAWKYKNGTFATEIFGIPKDESYKECLEMRYVVFLCGRDQYWRYVYNKKKKALPTLQDSDSGELMVVIRKEEFEPI